MDFDAVLNWLEAKKDWLFGGLGATVVGVVLAWILSGGFRKSAVDVKEVIAGLQATYREELREKEEQIQELTKAVEALIEERGKADASPGIGAALEQLARGETGAAENIFQRVLEEQKKVEGEASLKEAAAAARHIGALADLHDTDKALSSYTEAVRLDPDDPDGWNMLGRLRRRVGDLDGAEEGFERVLALGNRISDKSVMAVAHGNLGIISATRGDLAKAEEYFLKSLAVNEELGRKEGMAAVYGNLGLIYQTRGDLAKAEEYHLKSLAIEEKLGRKEGTASQYGNLGLIYETRGDLAKAEEYHLKSLAIEKELGRKEGMASDYGNLGLVYRTRGDLAKAEEFYLKALAINEELGRKEGMANNYGNLGNVYRMRGDLAKAEEFYLKALAIEEELGRKEGMANAYGNLGNLYQSRGDLAKACGAWSKSRRLYIEVGAADRAERVRRSMDEAGCAQEKAGTKDEAG